MIIKETSEQCEHRLEEFLVFSRNKQETWKTDAGLGIHRISRVVPSSTSAHPVYRIEYTYMYCFFYTSIASQALRSILCQLASQSGLETIKSPSRHQGIAGIYHGEITASVHPVWPPQKSS
jgi:hypothetical protein